MSGREVVVFHKDFDQLVPPGKLARMDWHVGRKWSVVRAEAEQAVTRRLTVVLREGGAVVPEAGAGVRGSRN
jgi:hypothetical protein